MRLLLLELLVLEFITIHVLLGTIALLLAVVVSFLFYFYGNDTTVICHEEGFTVKNANRVKGTSLHEYGWQEVTETKYYDNESEEDHLPKRRILVKTASGPVFNLYAMKGFDELISIINQKTNHLPYKWEKPGVFSYKYKKQERSFS